MIPDRRRKNYTAAVLVPLVAAAVTAWSEHRTAQNKERQDAAYAVTAPALRDLQLEQAKLVARVDLLTRLVSDHVIHHPSASATQLAPSSSRRIRVGSIGMGGAGSLGAGSAAPAPAQDQISVANQLKSAPALRSIQRSIPASPDEAVQEMKK